MGSAWQGYINTEPTSKMVFNAPFDDSQTYDMKILNVGSRRIGWTCSTTNPKRLELNPSCGVLNPGKSVLVAVCCKPINIISEGTQNDQITVKWTNTPNGSTAPFSGDWFKKHSKKRLKNLPVEYNS